MSKYISKRIYLLLITFLPILSLLIGLIFRGFSLSAWESFEFSLPINYYLPIVSLGILAFLYAIVVFYSKSYNESYYFKIITSLYLILFVLLQISSFNLLFLTKILAYEGLNLFIVFNLVIYFVLTLSHRL
jgi:hypothetical protein